MTRWRAQWFTAMNWYAMRLAWSLKLNHLFSWIIENLFDVMNLIMKWKFYTLVSLPRPLSRLAELYLDFLLSLLLLLGLTRPTSTPPSSNEPLELLLWLQLMFADVVLLLTAVADVDAEWPLDWQILVDGLIDWLAVKTVLHNLLGWVLLWV
jgi:hypothetical protein